MKERPILFSAPMVRAILDGKKTMTRRIYKPRFDSWQVGDRLWCKETYLIAHNDSNNKKIIYAATDPNLLGIGFDYAVKCSSKTQLPIWKPSIFMPRKYSRILLEITELKKEHIKDCSNEDAVKEGFLRNIEFWEYFWKMNSKLYPQGVDEMVLMVNPEVLAIGFKVLEVKNEANS